LRFNVNKLRKNLGESELSFVEDWEQKET
jgi:hypothetical protein